MCPVWVRRGGRLIFWRGRLEGRPRGVALPEAALRFPLGHPAVVSVIAGAQRASEVRRNAAMMGAKLPAALWRALKTEKLLREDAPTPR